MMSFALDIRDETSPLEAVAVGIATDPGISRGHNLTDSEHSKSGTLPNEKDLIGHVGSLCDLLEKRGIELIHPSNVPSIMQIFVRDLGFVIGKTLFWGNLKRATRKQEQEAFKRIIKSIDPNISIVEPPGDFLMEGGDIVLLNGKVFVGVGWKGDRRRTDPEAITFLKSHLPEWEVIPLTTRASDDASSGDNPRENVLHLDCAFQPLGTGHAILFKNGFIETPHEIIDVVGADKIIEVDGDEMFNLFPNLFSIAPDKVISSPHFQRLNASLRQVGIEVLEVPYDAVAKHGGLFRCSTLPLRRTYNDK